MNVAALGTTNKNIAADDGPDELDTKGILLLGIHCFNLELNFNELFS